MENNNSVKDFENLSIFQNARSLYKKLYPFTKRGEWKYDTRFVQQIRAAAGSIMDRSAASYDYKQGKRTLS